MIDTKQEPTGKIKFYPYTATKEDEKKANRILLDIFMEPTNFTETDTQILAQALSAQRESYEKKIAELEKDRDLAREMLIADTTHISCGIFEEKQRKKIAEFEDIIAALSILKIEYERKIESSDFRLTKLQLEINSLREAGDKLMLQLEDGGNDGCKHCKKALSEWEKAKGVGK